MHLFLPVKTSAACANIKPFRPPSLGRWRTLTRVHPDYEAADDEHLERLGPLTEGEQQRCEDGEAVVQQQRSLPAGETVGAEGGSSSITKPSAHRL